MSEKAIVKEIISENIALVVKLPGERLHNDCSGCGVCGMFDKRAEVTATVLNLLGAKPGDAVWIENHGKNLVSLSFVLFGCPIVMPLVFYLIGSLFGSPVIVCGVMAAFGLYAAYLTIKFCNKKVAGGLPALKITKVQRNGEDVPCEY